MTIYLPNSDLRPTGNEPAEFIDAPAGFDEATPEPPLHDRSDELTARVSNQSRGPGFSESRR